MKSTYIRFFIALVLIMGEARAQPVQSETHIGLKQSVSRAQQPKTHIESLRIATWNMAWMANDVLDATQAKNCYDEAKKFSDMEKRPSKECQKGTPFRQLADYQRMAKHAKQLDADILGIQEVQGLPAIQKILDGALPSTDADNQISQGTYFLASYSQGGWQKTAIAIRKSILDPTFSPVPTDFFELGSALPRDQRGGLEVKFKLIDGSYLTILSIHLKSRCVEDGLDTPNDHCPQLSLQAPVLGAWIAAKAKAREHFIVLGDFNRSFASNIERTCGATKTDCKKHALGAWIDTGDFAQAPVVISTADLSHPAGCFDTRYSNAAIEHIVFGGGAESLLVSRSAKTVPYVDPITKLPISDHKRSVQLYSDHCVVTVEARY
nr:endonuclease/exonuclease/phosphatase family protein [uncultured Rhodoferax sp.]